MQWYECSRVGIRIETSFLFFAEVYFPVKFKDTRVLVELSKSIRPSENKLSFNLAEHLPKHLNSSAPRFRISELKVLLMDKEKNVLYHGSDFDADNVVVDITFPKTFYDHAISDDGKKIQFGVTKAYSCRSVYFKKSNTLLYYPLILHA